MGGHIMAIKNKTISFRVDENTYNNYSKLAIANRRKLGDFIRLLLEDSLKKD